MIRALSASQGAGCGTQATSAFRAIQSDSAASPTRNVMRVPLPTRRSSMPSSVGGAARASARDARCRARARRRGRLRAAPGRQADRSCSTIDQGRWLVNREDAPVRRLHAGGNSPSPAPNLTYVLFVPRWCRTVLRVRGSPYPTRLANASHAGATRAMARESSVAASIGDVIDDPS